MSRETTIYFDDPTPYGFTKWDYAHMDCASRYAQLSPAVRLKVGSVVVKDNRIISIGYNGMPSKWSNVCEEVDADGNLVTKKEVLHAEANAILKLSRSTESAEGATLYVTHVPCLDCAKMIYASGIERVIWKEVYRSLDGLNFLASCGIEIDKID